MTPQLADTLARPSSVPAISRSASPAVSADDGVSVAPAERPRPTPSSGRPLRRILDTGPDGAAALARVALGLLMFPHGAQHALGWLGGYGFSGTHAWMTKTLGFPAPLAALAIVTELLAPLALLMGLAGRVAALGIIGIMLGAILTHAPNGFFMNWFGGLPAGQEGFEYHLMTIALAAVVVIKGSGWISLDRQLERRVEYGR